MNMLLQNTTNQNIFEIKGCQDISVAVINTELAQAEKRLEIWENKSYYQKVASLAKIADMLPDSNDLLSIMIRAEIDALLNLSHREIAEL